MNSGGGFALTANDEDHRPPLESGAGSESSIRKSRHIETEARGGGSVERLVLRFVSHLTITIPTPMPTVKIQKTISA
ncbi:MAG: hypothetical protein LR011_13990 [Verrucomicrobia bacterium]|nr:hypothetical protein [Verrucomicrobiota bacterium]